jgi:hypothetical protein
MICNVRANLRGIGLALIAAGFCVADEASAACVGLSGTADGFTKTTAVSRAQRSLAEFIEKYKAETISTPSLSAPCARNRSLIGAGA